MRLLINLNNVGENEADIIKEKLHKLDLPECIGNMCPPLVPSTVYLDSNDFLQVSTSIPPDNKVDYDVTALLATEYDESTITYLKDMSLDVNSFTKIETLKKDLADNYVYRIKKCAAPCPYIELCNMLTTHYLNTIKLSKMNGGT